MADRARRVGRMGQVSLPIILLPFRRQGSVDITARTAAAPGR